MSSKEWFKSILAELKASMASHGFKKKGDGFFKIFPEAEAIFNFRKSRETSNESLVFTCYLGLRYSVLDRFCRIDPPLHMQSNSEADKRILARELSTSTFNGNWTVNSMQSMNDALNHIETMLPNVVALSERYSSTNAFIDEYLNSIETARIEKQALNVKEAALVAAFYLQSNRLQEAENVMTSLREISKDQGISTNALEGAWNYYSDRNKPNE
jgi:hypothetical protein